LFSGIEVPPGILLFEDPPLHDLHRRLLSRVFTPRRMLAVEDLVRDFCSRALDPLRDSDGFDFVADLGATMPMRTIGDLLGIPEEGQQQIRDLNDKSITVAEGPQMSVPRSSRRRSRCSPSTSSGGRIIRPTT
jgi:cytochrome P450